MKKPSSDARTGPPNDARRKDVPTDEPSVRGRSPQESLQHVRADLETLTREAAIGALVLDACLRIRRRIGPLADLFAEDVGAAATDDSAVNLTMHECARSVAADKRVVERCVAGPEGRWLSLRCQPYAFEDGSDGVFVSVTDVTERRRVEQQVVEVSTRERSRIGRELHDILGSHLTAIAMLAWGRADDLKKQRPVAPEALEEIAKIANEGIAQARALAQGLNPVLLEEQGLVASLQRMLASNPSVDAGRCKIDADDPLPELSGEQLAHLYRIAQEAYSLAIRHAQATSVHVAVRVEPGHLVVSVADDGRRSGRSDLGDEEIGWHIMRYRANAIGATLHVGEDENGRTVVSCTLPVDVPDAGER